MVIKWRCVKWFVLNLDDGEQVIFEYIEGSFIYKAYFNWKGNFLYFETFKSFVWGIFLSGVLRGYLL